jgi:hypothetical protein
MIAVKIEVQFTSFIAPYVYVVEHKGAVSSKIKAN